MSVSTEITRLTGLKGRIRTWLVALGLVQSGATLEDCTDALEGIRNRGAVEGSIADKAVPYTIPAGYHNGQGKVSIAAAELAKLIGSNIKSGVTILGVKGAYTGEAAKLQSKRVTPTKTTQEITADDGYDAMSAVTVEAIPSAYQDVTGVTAAASEVLANKIFVDAAGKQTPGTMPNNGAVAGSIDGLTVTEYAVSAGYHSGIGKVVLTGDIEAALAAI